MGRIPERYFHWLLVIGIWLKGLDGLIELVCGAVLVWADLRWLRWVVAMMTRGELIEDPHDLLANLFVRTSQHMTAGEKRFAGAYLAGHGFVKLALAWAVLSRRLRLYPPAMIVLGLFLGYELYELVALPKVSDWLVLACAFDMAVLALVWHEYRRLRAADHG